MSSPYNIVKHKKAYTVISFISVLLIWYIGAQFIKMLPSPLEVGQAFILLAWRDGTSPLLDASIASLIRIFMASALVITIGIPLGLMMGTMPRLDAFLSPLLDPLRSAPIVALLPLFVIWFGVHESMKVLFLFTGAVIYLIPMVRDSIKAVPYQYWETIKDLGGSYWECIRHSLIPIAAPRIADSIITCFSIMWTYITVAEYVNAASGLGQLLQNARRNSALDQMIAGILTIILLSFLTYKLLYIIKQKAFSWDVYK